MGNRIKHGNWSVHWRVTESAGVMVYLADFKGKRVLWEASLPYVTIDHQPDSDIEIDDGGGLSHGPMWAALGTRSLVEHVRTNVFRGGFELAADFISGPFRYTQLWRFLDDGRMAPWLTIYGNGVHDGHTYHPHWRFDFDVAGAIDDSLEHYEDGKWRKVLTEGWFPFGGDGDKHGAAWRQIDSKSKAKVAIQPNGWEDAELFAVRYHDGEWPPFTPHGGPGGQPFPAAYVGSESVSKEDVTLWYVGHVHYSSSFPFTAGPWLRVSGIS